MTGSGQNGKALIRVCRENDFDDVCSIVNESAQAYRGVIPPDCWHEPYMKRDELRREVESGVSFFGYERNAKLLGVMGMQFVEDATLIRHAYVRTAVQREGIGMALLTKIMKQARLPVLVGTWAAAIWAIDFYRKLGFEMVSPEQAASLLRRYWRIPRRQIETSVVLLWNEAHNIPTVDCGSGDI